MWLRNLELVAKTGTRQQLCNLERRSGNRQPCITMAVCDGRSLVTSIAELQKRNWATRPMPAKVWKRSAKKLSRPERKYATGTRQQLLNLKRRSGLRQPCNTMAACDGRTFATRVDAHRSMKHEAKHFDSLCTSPDTPEHS